MLVAVFGDAHAQGDALDAVLNAADACGVDQYWSLGDMVGGGPDPERVVAATRERCSVAIVGNHDYGVTGAVDPSRLGPHADRSIRLARDRLTADDIEWLRSRKPAARRGDVQCWHGSPRNPVWEFVGPRNASACLALQKAPIGLVGHTHAVAAWQMTTQGHTRGVEVAVDVEIDISEGKWLLNPGAVASSSSDGTPWLLLDVEARTATFKRARSPVQSVITRWISSGSSSNMRGSGADATSNPWSM